MKKYLRDLFIRFAGSLKLRLEEILRDENERRMSEVLREIEVRNKTLIRQARQQCPHIAGSNPASEHLDVAGRTSIVWHRNNLGIDLGICSVCQRVFLPTDDDYHVWRKKPSFHRLSCSGQYINISEKMKAVCLENLMVDSGIDAPIPVPLPSQAEIDEHVETTDDPWLIGDPFYQSRVEFGMSSWLGEPKLPTESKEEEEKDEHPKTT